MVFENYPLHEELKKTGINAGEVYGTAIDFQVEDIEVDDQSNYDFNVIIIPGKPFITRFSYNPAAYENDFIEGVGRHFMEIVKQVKDNPNLALEEIEILPAGEKQRILWELSRSDADYPIDRRCMDCLQGRWNRPRTGSPGGE